MPTIVMREGENEFIGGMVFHKRVKQLIEDMPPGEPVVIDLQNLYLDSSVIGTILAIHTTCKRDNREMKLERISQATLKILRLTGLAKLLNIEDTKINPEP